MLSRNAENYLRIILEVVEANGYARSKDICSRLKVKPSSVTEMLVKLRNDGMILYEKGGAVRLTETGHNLASTVNQKYKVFLKLFELAGVSPIVAYHDACAIEHWVSDETYRALQIFVDKISKR